MPRQLSARFLPQAPGKHMVIKPRGFPRAALGIKWADKIKIKKGRSTLHDFDTSVQIAASECKASNKAKQPDRLQVSVTRLFILRQSHVSRVNLLMNWCITILTRCWSHSPENVNYLNDKSEQKQFRRFSSITKVKWYNYKLPYAAPTPWGEDTEAKLSLLWNFTTTTPTPSKRNHPISRGDQTKAPPMPDTRSDIALATKLTVLTQCSSLCNDSNASSTGQSGPQEAGLAGVLARVWQKLESQQNAG